jgi:tetratricopeptide (TPR) repeat protein
MKLIVGFVALTFLGGFVGSFAVRSLGDIDEPAPQENDFAEQLSDMVDQMEADLVYYNVAAEEDPDNVDNYIMLGDIYYDLAGLRSGYYGEEVTDYLEQARDSYTKAFDLDASRKNLMLSIAMVGTALSDFTEAASYYELFLAEYPESFEANALYTQMLVLSEETDQAQDWLEKTKELAVSDEEIGIIEQLQGMVNPS